MRVLLITRNLPPLVGGMERLNWHMADELSRRADIRVVAPKGASARAPDGVWIRETASASPALFLADAIRLSSGIVARWRPDVVLAGSGLTAPVAWITARLCGARMAVYTHGLDLTVRHPIYRSLWLPAIRRADILIANSHATARLAVARGMADAHIRVIHPGVSIPAADTNGVHPGRTFRARHAIGNRPVLLSVGRLSARKGIREFVNQVLPLIARHRPDVLLAVIGGEPKNALSAEAQSPHIIKQDAERLGLANNVLFAGETDDEELANAYRTVDVHVFPACSRANDPEGFGMVAIEAAAHGLQTVAYATGGVTDAVEHGVSGYLVPPDDAVAFARSILLLLESPLPREAIRAFGKRFEWPRFGASIASALRSG